MHPLVARLDAALAANYPNLCKSLGPGSSQQDLDELEDFFGAALPAAYRDFLAWRGPQPDAVDSTGDIYIRTYGLTTAQRALEKVRMMRQLRAAEPGWRESVWWGEYYLPLMEHGGPELVIDVAGETRLKNDDGSSELFRSVPGQVVEFHHADEFL
ncbi:hypothetical protein TPB0596_08210 [Tsukamurella pulmonis]|uniref:SMI1/KNR4 family protein n=1 Tax=Tsukamurella pulmonis TaxID=47312 RepID=UPI001EE0B959|nr:SMI1/KNR4 family protein [Tsukamurella pulmonis]BDD81058.1 hypothetical protein TPB0596_08210 [Tsukamurella pulmonis]